MRISQTLCVVILALLCIAKFSFADRLNYLEEPCDPYYVGTDFPILTTPQWIGDENVDAVVILSIDDMRDPSRYEAYLRPILNRLKRINGKAPLSIFTNQVDPSDAQLQTWLREGLSIEVHTVDHPCPLLKDDDFDKAKSTYDRCVDMLSQIEGTRPVAFRMPCCDSLNTPSPRFYNEIFNSRTADGGFLEVDSSVFNIFNENDKQLPQEIVRRNNEERFQRYLPFPSFVNTIENYPYPYVIGRLCWEFPCVVPSDWEAQNLHRPFNPVTVEDLKKALDATVIKKGIMPIVFHPHGWIRNEQMVDLIDFSVQKYGDRVKFMTFPEALKLINKHLLDGMAIRAKDGSDSGIRLVDVNHDGFIDVVRPNKNGTLTKVWRPESNSWQRVECDLTSQRPRFGLSNGNVILSGVDKQQNRFRVFAWNDDAWSEREISFADIDGAWKNINEAPDKLDDIRWKDIDEDGTSELLVTHNRETAILRYDTQKQISKLPIEFPKEATLANAKGNDAGLRFRDINNDGLDDIVFSDGRTSGVWLFESMEKGWVRESGSQNQDIPAIVRNDGTNNGAWFHSNHLWLQNENTARLPDLVDRVSFDELLTDARSALELKEDEEDEFPGPVLADEALSTFQTLDGFRLELVAAEPQLVDPVAFDWGADGRLWVAEMSDYPNGGTWHGPNDPLDEPGGRVRVLTDPDGDGRFDQSQVFLDGLTVPTGVKSWRNGVLVVVAPKIIYAEDTNNDGKADHIETLIEGLGEGNQQHRANGLRWGLDHWLHVANGDSGGKIKSLKTGQEVAIRGHDFMIKPDEGLVQRVFGQTQFGRSRDDFGNWFGGNNSNPSWHYVLEEKYIDRNPHFIPSSPRRSLPVIPGASPVFPISKTLTRFNDFDRANRFTSACSPEIFRDTMMSATSNSYIYVCEPVHNLVNRQKIESNGVTFSSRRGESEATREFLASTDNWFRPVMVRTGPDGALWVADMYRLVIEHPEWIPMSWQKKLDLRAGHDRGRIYRVIATNSKSDLEPYPSWKELKERATEDLVDLLRHKNGTLRDMVHQVLYWRNDARAIKPLEGLFKSEGSYLAQIHALYLLQHLNALTDTRLVNAITEGAPDVSRHAMRLADSRLESSPVLQQALLKAVRTEANSRAERQHVLQLANSLGNISNSPSGISLARLAIAHGSDQHIRTSVLSSLNSANLQPFVDEALRLLIDNEGHQVQSLLANQNFIDQLLSTAVGLGSPKVCVRMIDFGTTQENAQFFAVFNGVTRALRRHGKSPEEFFSGEDASVFFRFQRQLKILAVDKKARLNERLASIEAFDSGQPLSVEDKTSLLTLCAADQPIAIQQRALQILANTAETGILSELIARWESFTPTLQNLLTDAIFKREAAIKILLEAVASGTVHPNQINVRRRNDLFTHRNAEISKLANKLFVQADSDRAKVVARYAKVDHRAGDSETGRGIFQKKCSACHKLGGMGRDVGPNLLALSDKSIPTLLTAILDPNKAVEDKYLEYIVVTQDGQQIAGVIAQENENAITLATPDGKNTSVLRSQVEALKATGRSFMPVGLEQEVSIEQMKHLLAFVREFRAPAKQFAGNNPRVAPVRNDGSIRLFSMYANIYGSSLVFEPTYRNLGFWSSSDDQATWSINSPRAGEYSVHLDYACPDAEAGGQFQIQAAGKKIVGTVKPTGGWNHYQGMSVGTIELPEGETELSIQSFGSIDGYLMDLRTIILYPK